MSKQWGHGYWCGEKNGKYDAREEYSSTMDEYRLQEQCWVADELCNLIKSMIWDYEKDSFDDMRFLFVALETVHEKIRAMKEKNKKPTTKPTPESDCLIVGS